MRLFLLIVALGMTLWVRGAAAAVYYVNVSNPVPASPFTTWDTAATNIQDAIDASTNGDQVLVTNGVYQFGGTVMAGDLTNRVAVNKPLSVQSVNGPWVTTIQGAGAVNGTAAVRCAWLTNGASLKGFTLMAGATRTSGDTVALRSGGGVWCASSNSTVLNCVVVSNTGAFNGAGIFQGTVANSLINGNGPGSIGGGAVYNTVLNNCTIVSNTAWGVVNAIVMTNCIIYYNPLNCSVSGSAYSHCCTIPALAGVGNFTNAPQFFIDGVHLTNSSPCIGAGVNPPIGTDIFGQAWSNPPAIGCAEWQYAPVLTHPQIRLTGNPIGFTVSAAPPPPRLPPFAYSWLKDGIALQDNGHYAGTQTTNLAVTGVSYADAGGYQLVVSNSFGVVTGAMVQLVIHCVDAAGTSPISPFITWATAATNIQDAITAAAAGDVVLVTNGLYFTGGVSMDGIITNRVCINKAILVQSLNGANATTISGAWDSAGTNGPGAIRCVWLTNNATISGFTIVGGATRTTGSSAENGGGIWGASTNATVLNCNIHTNFAYLLGGGAYRATLLNCALVGNVALGSGMHGAGEGGAGMGGGAELSILGNCVLKFNSAVQNSGGAVDNCSLYNCAFVGNSSYLNGGAANGGSLVNCTITQNTASGYSSGYGAAVYGATLNNCIVFGNISRTSYPNTNYASCTFAYSCSDPLPAGTGNIDVNPQFLADGIHLASTSPCIGAGAGVATSLDIDGQLWNNPPSIGCDEWQPVPVVAVQPVCRIGVPHSLTFTVALAGQSPFSYFWWKDGAPITDGGQYGGFGTGNLTVNNFGLDDAGIYQVLVTNLSGAVTSSVVQVIIHAVSVGSTNPVVPYSTWATAATNIQDAIDVASEGEIVLVTNGIYATGGKALSGDLTNRAALDKPITLTSVNGYATTVIQGVRDPVSTNGPSSVRCAWLADGAVLNGFMLANGSTRASGSGFTLISGGGVWCNSTNGLVTDCIMSNDAAIYGGGIAFGKAINSLVLLNVANFGGGAFNASLLNCTIVLNSVLSLGGGVYNCITRNSIITGNSRVSSGSTDNYSAGAGTFCCSSPIMSGTGNINLNAQFLDFIHLATNSPCRGTGSSLYASGFDLDGWAWASPPSMGCDEVIISNLVGSLGADVAAGSTNILVNQFDNFAGIITGRASMSAWAFGDGVKTTNGAYVGHQWTNSGDYPVTFTVYNNDNPAGVSASLMVHVEPVYPPQLQVAGITSSPFRFQFAGQTNATYTIQYTTNLSPPVAWKTLQTVSFNRTNVIQISDPGSTNNARYYRVSAQ